MCAQSIWKIKSSSQQYACLEHNIETEVAIIGGGITGITTAMLLHKHGVKVVVLEARKVGQGTTGNSTGNLYMLTEHSLSDLEKKYDIPTIRKVIEARIKAMHFIRENIQQYQIDCDYSERSMYIFENDESIDIAKEQELAAKIGLNFAPMEPEDFPLPFKKGIEFKNQAQINPLTYVQHLAKELYNSGCQIFEDSRVLEIDDKKDYVILKTDRAQIRAKRVIHATHTPIGLQLQYHTALGPYREYGVSFKIKNNNYPKGIFWGRYNDKKYSLRSYETETDTYLICVGGMHKVGQAGNNLSYIQDLEDFITQHFDVEEIVHRWGGQNYKPADLLPYIGEKESGSREYVATGYSTDGLVYGSLAAMILSDEIIGKKNMFWNFFKASRHQPVKAAKNFTKENLNMAAKLIGDFLKSGEKLDIRDLSPDEGKIVSHKGGKVAIYKNAEGQVSFLSPICPHFGCTVHWNNLEKTWDCPCHGSRFDTQGRVIEGPALGGLKGKNRKTD